MRDRRGFVYLLKSTTDAWKIGRTRYPNDRRKTFGVKLPYPVEYDHLIPTNDAVRLERNLHNRFCEKRRDGEWFVLDEEDIRWIKQLNEHMTFNALCQLTHEDNHRKYRENLLNDPDCDWYVTWRGCEWDVKTKHLSHLYKWIDSQYPIDCLTEWSHERAD
jgi:hypothetical protein